MMRRRLQLGKGIAGLISSRWVRFMLNDGARYFDKAERDRQHALRRIQRRRTLSVANWTVVVLLAPASVILLAAAWLWPNWSWQKVASRSALDAKFREDQLVSDKPS